MNDNGYKIAPYVTLHIEKVTHSERTIDVVWVRDNGFYSVSNLVGIVSDWMEEEFGEMINSKWMIDHSFSVTEAEMAMIIFDSELLTLFKMMLS